MRNLTQRLQKYPRPLFPDCGVMARWEKKKKEMYTIWQKITTLVEPHVETRPQMYKHI